eukprot:4913810-Pyramimonas_sp.AAC.2
MFQPRQRRPCNNHCAREAQQRRPGAPSALPWTAALACRCVCRGRVRIEPEGKASTLALADCSRRRWHVFSRHLRPEHTSLNAQLTPARSHTIPRCASGHAQAAPGSEVMAARKRCCVSRHPTHAEAPGSSTASALPVELMEKWLLPHLDLRELAEYACLIGAPVPGTHARCAHNGRGSVLVPGQVAHPGQPAHASPG